METYIVNTGNISLYAAPSYKSEMVSQILFGEAFKIIKRQRKWILINNLLDEYEGWINSSLFTPFRDTYENSLEDQSIYICQEPVNYIKDEKSQTFSIPGGSLLRNFSPDDGSFKMNGVKYYLVDYKGLTNNNSLREKIISLAIQYLHTPYLWGGKNPMGIDCSGFTQIIYRMIRYNLPRDSSEQMQAGRSVSFLEEAQKGDLAFFDNEEGIITHTGIVLNTQQIIHASESVKTEKLDHQGIFNRETNKYSHKLRLIKNLLD